MKKLTPGRSPVQKSDNLKMVSLKWRMFAFTWLKILLKFSTKHICKTISALFDYGIYIMRSNINPFDNIWFHFINIVL